VLIDYNRRIAKGELSPLTGLTLYEQTLNEAEKNLIGLTAADGTKIETIQSHFVARVIGNKKRTGVTIANVRDALLNPNDKIQSVKNRDTRITFVGKKCDVTISTRDKKVIQTNPRHAK
jgi:hypothetical protein